MEYTVTALKQDASKPKFKWFWSRIAVASAQSIEPRSYVMNEDVVGAAPTGDAPTTSE